MDILMDNIKVVCGEFQSFVSDMYKNAKTEDERNAIKSMISVLYEMY